MSFFTQNRTPILALVLGVLAIVAYYTFWGGSGSGSSLLSSAPAPSSDSQQLLTTLGNLDTVTLDDSIFKNDVFVSLADFGTVIPAQVAGRHNPFAPITGATAPASAGKTKP